ncbi:MAG: RraA family protein [Actinobacteria bacterium]|nr:RraA family protein [Actinomycetota bacterium]
MTAETTVLARLHDLSTTSLVDAAPTLRILPAALRPVVPGGHLAGRVVTALANRDLMPVLSALREAGPGDVLVVDAGGEDRAVAGELFATEAQRRGLAGLVIFGRSRDTPSLARLSMPVWSTGFAPNAYPARAIPVPGLSLSLGGVPVRPGELMVGDDDGLVVGAPDEFAAAVDAAAAIELRERGLQAQILGGACLFDAMNYDEHLAALGEGRPGGLAIG